MWRLPLALSIPFPVDNTRCRRSTERRAQLTVAGWTAWQYSKKWAVTLTPPPTFFPLRVKGSSQTEERSNMDTAEKCYPTSAPGETSKVCWLGYGLGFEPRTNQVTFLFSETSRPLQLSIQKVLCKVAGLTTHLHQVPRIRVYGSLSPLLHTFSRLGT